MPDYALLFFQAVFQPYQPFGQFANVTVCELGNVFFINFEM